jgi:dTDP-4-amino-4,6-dideoxygalactose transaminase
MIPRTRVNYTLSELLHCAVLGNCSSRYRTRLISQLSEFLGIKHILLTPSGRSALYILLRALPQKKVVVPAYTCKAVVESALLAGKEVRYVDVDPQDFNMDVSLLESSIDSTTIVIATHQFGIPCDIRRICEISAKRGAVVVEDVAAAFGSKVGKRLTGTFAAASFFSFDSTKLINVPLKAGFLAINDAALYECVTKSAAATLRPMSIPRRLSLLGQAFVLLAIEHPLVYRCFHKLHFEWRDRFTADSAKLHLKLTDFYVDEMAEWQAYLASKQFERLEHIIKNRQKVYAEFYSGLLDCPSIELPPPDKHQEWSCIRFPIRVKGDKIAFYKAANRKGVDFAFSFTFIAAPQHMKQSHSIANAILDLPFYVKMTDEEVRRTIRVIRSLAV